MCMYIRTLCVCNCVFVLMSGCVCVCVYVYVCVCVLMLVHVCVCKEDCIALPCLVSEQQSCKRSHTLPMKSCIC